MKKHLLIVIVATLLLMLSSCFTTVSVSSLAPAEIDIGANQVIAVSPTENRTRSKSRTIPVYVDDGVPVPDGLKRLKSTETYEITNEVSEYVSQSLFESLSEGVYKVVNPATTKSYLKEAKLTKSQSEVLKSKGVTLLLESSLDYLDIDEYIKGKAYKNSEGKTYYKYFLCQSVDLGFSYRLNDVNSEKNVDSMTYSGSYPVFSLMNETLIAQIDANGKFTMDPEWYSSTKWSAKQIVESFKQQIRNRLVPHVIRLNFDLMESKEFSEINKLVNEGYLSIALDQYLAIYQQTGSIIAGYNCAVLYYGLGNPSEAISFAQDLYNKTLSADVGKLLVKMTTAYSANQTAREQAGL